MNLSEALLTDLLLDLTDQYGSAFPRPAGLVLNFQVIVPNTTYAKAKKDIEALLTLYGPAGLEASYSRSLKPQARSSSRLR